MAKAKKTGCQTCGEPVKPGADLCEKRVECVIDMTKPCRESFDGIGRQIPLLINDEEIFLTLRIIDSGQTITVSGQFVTHELSCV